MGTDKRAFVQSFYIRGSKRTFTKKGASSVPICPTSSWGCCPPEALQDPACLGFTVASLPYNWEILDLPYPDQEAPRRA
jgi:hypothetical protein